MGQVPAQLKHLTVTNEFAFMSVIINNTLHKPSCSIINRIHNRSIQIIFVHIKITVVVCLLISSSHFHFRFEIVMHNSFMKPTCQF
jgi:hypothetical protein